MVLAIFVVRYRTGGFRPRVIDISLVSGWHDFCFRSKQPTLSVMGNYRGWNTRDRSIKSSCILKFAQTHMRLSRNGVDSIQALMVVVVRNPTSVRDTRRHNVNGENYDIIEQPKVSRS